MEYQVKVKMPTNKKWNQGEKCTSKNLNHNFLSGSYIYHFVIEPDLINKTYVIWSTWALLPISKLI